MAAGKRLRTHVHVHQDDGTVKVYGPDDTDIPAADAGKIGDHCFLQDGEEPVVDARAGQVVSEDEEPEQKPARESSRRKS